MSDEPWLTGWKKPVLIVLGTAPLLVVVLAFVFNVRSELAFDESRCPYHDGEVRVVHEGVAVREDARTCSDGVEEHRWVLLRQGEPPLELGRLRRESPYFDEGYAWSPSEHEGRVEIEIRSPDQDPRTFREPAPDAGVRATEPT